ncbi:MAG: DUF3977 family protein [Nanoarchaeota archaeon]|nr:DUF3977 family protein [Nanoarchaeota archaeon]
MNKVYTEIGFGNTSFLSTEIEKGKEEYRINKFIMPKKIKEIYIRIWLLKLIIILSSSEGLKLKRKNKNNLKILFGFGGTR